jgi:Flp pilus assembly protein TadG
VPTTPRLVPQTRHPRHADHGAAMIEMAILLPLLLLIIFGLVDFGLALRTKIVMTAAAREGARLSALGESTGTVETRVRDAADPVPVDTISVTSGCGSTSPTTATVVATRTYTFLTPVPALGEFFGGGLPSSVTVKGKGVMRCAG